MKRHGLALASSVCMGILILDSATALRGVQWGLELCLKSLIPSLFPFLFVSALMTGAWMGSSPVLLEPVRKLCRIPAGCSCLLIPAFLGGYPAGAQAVGQTLHQGGLSRKDAGKMLLFCNNPGPSFLFGVLGNAFSERWMTWALWGICLLSSLLLAWMLPGESAGTGAVEMPEISLTGAMSAAMKSMASVCCWVIVFRMVITFLQRWFLWLVPQTLQVVLMGMLELSNGCLALSAIEDEHLRFVTAAGLLSFGGLCITMQTGSVCGNLPLLPYCISKGVQGALSVVLAASVITGKLFPAAVVMAVCCILKKTVAIRRKVVYNSPRMLRRNHYAVSKENGVRLRILHPRNPAG